MNYSQSTNEKAERFNTWRYKNKIDLPDVQIFFLYNNARVFVILKRLIEFFSREFERVN